MRQPENLTQELLFLRRAPPAPHDRHLASVGEAEGHDIDRVAEGVLGQPRAALAVARAAGVAAGPRLGHGRAEIQGGGRLHDLLEPGVDVGIIGQASVALRVRPTEPFAKAATLKGWLIPQTPGPSIEDMRDM